jgi:hypothetical protein
MLRVEALQIGGGKSRERRLRGSADLLFKTSGFETVKKSTNPVILSVAKNLQLSVFNKINADASLRSA